jgi:malate dehydrogenase (oxaloacetate-decarboxylating)(NADP+)
MALTDRPVITRLHGSELLRDPALNQSTACTEAERDAFGLVGLLPSSVDSEQTQVERVMRQLAVKPTDLERYIYVVGLVDTDETLFTRSSCLIRRAFCRLSTIQRSAKRV